MKRSLKDRFLTPVVARAMMSPLGILLFGLGTAGGILGKLPIVGAVAVGAAAWAARVAVAVPRDRRMAAGDRIDAYALSEPWRQYVQAAQSSKLRYDRVVTSTAPGPIRDRLTELGERLDEGIRDCWRVATRGDTIDDALSHLNTAQAKMELAEARRHLRERGPTPSLEPTIRSLEAQVASADRMSGVSADARDRLRLLDARLDELVARAVEVSVGTGDTGALSGDVDDIVTELESLRLALEETDRSADGVAESDRSISSQPGSPAAQPEQRSQTWPPSS